MSKLFSTVRRWFGVTNGPRMASRRYRVSIEVMYQAPKGQGRATIGLVELVTNANNPADAKKTAMDELIRGFTFKHTIHELHH